jgi:hypothetical protein
MAIPRMTAEYGIGPVMGTYVTSSASAGHGGEIVPMKGPLMRNTTATQDDRIFAKFSPHAPVLCDPTQSPCWGTGNHEYDYICCDANEHCDPKPDGTPDCSTPAPGFGNIRLPAGYQGVVS